MIRTQLYNMIYKIIFNAESTTSKIKELEQIKTKLIVTDENESFLADYIERNINNLSKQSRKQERQMIAH